MSTNDSTKKLNEFNTLYVEFVNQLRNTYSFVSEHYKEELTYTPIEEPTTTTTDELSAEEPEADETTEITTTTETQEQSTFTDEQLQYLLHYMQHVFPHIKYIARCDEEWFQDDGEDAEVVKGVKLNTILNDKATTTKQMNRVWEYLHTLYIRSQATKLTVTLLKERFADHLQYKAIKKSIIRYSDYLTLMVEFLSQQRNEADDEEEELSGEDDGGDADDEASPSEGTNSAANAAASSFFDNTLIGNLAKEISEEVDTSHLENMSSEQDIFSALFNGEGGSNMMGMMKTVCEKLDTKVKSGELNPQQMLSELGGSMMGPLMQNMMGGMGGVQPTRQQRRRAQRMAAKKAKKGKKHSSISTAKK